MTSNERSCRWIGTYRYFTRNAFVRLTVFSNDCTLSFPNLRELAVRSVNNKSIIGFVIEKKNSKKLCFIRSRIGYNPIFIGYNIQNVSRSNNNR